MKKKELMKKGLALLAAFTLVFGTLAGCGSKDEGSSDDSAATSTDAETDKEDAAPAEDDAAGDAKDTEASGDKPTIGIAMLDMTQEFFVNMIEGGDYAAEIYGVNLIWKSADSSLDNQIAIIENFIQQKVDCILLDPYDNVGLIPVCEEAKAAGIPVCSMGNFIDSDAVISNLYNDREDTKVIGELVGNLIDKSGDVAMLYGATGNFVSDERQGGWEEAMAEFPDIKCTYYEVGWDTAATLKTVQDILAANPDIKAIHSFSDGNTTAVAQAVDQAGLTGKVLISSYDGNKDASEAVKDGKYVCTLLTGAKRVGYWNVQIGSKLAKGETVEQKNYLESYFIMNDDMKAKVEELGIGYEGMNIVNPDKGIELFDDLSAFEEK
ncbi:sugar ABC transporter substrate-binding protein [Lactonifactor longoviformis]|uniref:Ribose transport system substrate-binding protein n=1 Tax=Lactonifactor longoviformis DSM 17459 TaxID=1122155 RepID=A0A1M5B277_9CLOT|nr:sugar ABC transporter substrate-binding protein [Lactonifactor longoviformis]POP33903.1 sugar ABC transporter substrate-binding protein [Lactonifactor longoviformis]SHF36593.1 ribose transport system substrate-binding protein [Lactonifactor longoviformis DSM 17459]